jgi:hypothetical protein
MMECLMLDKGAVANTLHAAMHGHMADYDHASSPASMTRVPVQRETDQRSTERI